VVVLPASMWAIIPIFLINDELINRPCLLFHISNFILTSNFSPLGGYIYLICSDL
jgi:hypothetical protein